MESEEERPREAAVGGVRAAWRALGDWRAVLAGTAVLGVAVLLGPLEAGVIGFAAYRVFREPASAALTDEETVAELSESVLSRIGKNLVAPASGAALVLCVIEVGGIVYFGYRMIRRWRAERREEPGATRMPGRTLAPERTLAPGATQKPGALLESGAVR